jgi:hypothetical protein
MARETRDEGLESTVAESLLERAKLLSIDQEELKRLVAARMRRLVTWKPEPMDPAATNDDRKKQQRRAQSHINEHIPKDDIGAFLGEHIEALRKRIQDIPGGPDKAMLGLDALVESGTWYGNDGIYDAMVLTRDNISQNHVTVEIEFWKQQRERDRQKGLPRYNGIFWSSGHG